MAISNVLNIEMRHFNIQNGFGTNDKLTSQELKKYLVFTVNVSFLTSITSSCEVQHGDGLNFRWIYLRCRV